jgi:hypothetical protein
MPPVEPAAVRTDWAELARAALRHYDEPLLRQVAGRLVKPRGLWPVDDLIDRSLATLQNAPVIDRRLKELPPACRKLLAIVGHSRRPRWQVGPLLSLLAALGHSEGFTPILTLLEEGLLFPELPTAAPPLKSFESWVGIGAPAGLPVFVLPEVGKRARLDDLGLPELPSEPHTFTRPVREADGLDWLVRLAVVWQQAQESPLRRTNQGDFFKRDLQRLRTDPLLNNPGPDHLADLPDAGPLSVALARQIGLLRDEDGALAAGDWPAAWQDGLGPALASLWPAITASPAWDPVRGWIGSDAAGENPYPPLLLLSLLLLSRVSDGGWVRPAAVQTWVAQRHPFWAGRTFPAGEDDWATPLLCGLAFGLRLVQGTPDGEGGWLVRLSPTGAWLLRGGEPPAPPPAFRQTLLVQPNCEVVVYRQGITPALLADLTRLAAWKAVGAACTLELNAGQVYRGLETGLTLDGVLRLLNQHGMRPVPDAVAASLKTWADKRERIVVYGRATLLEFATPADLDEAAARGLITTRLTDRLGLVADESQMQYKHFRLTGSRDYAAPPEQCVDVAADGVTLSVDGTRSDLLLDSELSRVAEAVPTDDTASGGRRWRLTRESLKRGLRGGGLAALDDWFVQRTGSPLPPAGRLLATAEHQPAARAARHLVLEVPTPEVADGLEQLPATRPLLSRRLGPTAFLVAEESAETLRQRLQALGLALEG